jgi:hypothetical protein
VVLPNNARKTFLGKARLALIQFVGWERVPDHWGPALVRRTRSGPPFAIVVQDSRCTTTTKGRRSVPVALTEERTDTGRTLLAGLPHFLTTPVDLGASLRELFIVPTGCLAKADKVLSHAAALPPCLKEAEPEISLTCW